MKLRFGIGPRLAIHNMRITSQAGHRYAGPSLPLSLNWIWSQLLRSHYENFFIAIYGRSMAWKWLSFLSITHLWGLSNTVSQNSGISYSSLQQRSMTELPQTRFSYLCSFFFQRTTAALHDYCFTEMERPICTSSNENSGKICKIRIPWAETFSAFFSLAGKMTPHEPHDAAKAVGQGWKLKKWKRGGWGLPCQHRTEKHERMCLKSDSPY